MKRSTRAPRRRGPTFVIDFDSTVVDAEALDELAELSLVAGGQRERALEEIRELTRRGMEGGISITESLERRIELLQANRKHLPELIRRLKRQITPSFRRNKAFLRRNADRVWIVSSGFREYVCPVVAELGIPAERVCANEFRFDRTGAIIGFDRSNPLAKAKGKTDQLRRLKLKGDVVVIGDGMTDAEMRESGVVTEFVAFVENVERAPVVAAADRVARSLDEVLYAWGEPLKVSYPKSRIQVLLLEAVHPRAAEILSAEGFAVETRPDALDEASLARELRNVSVLGIRSRTRVTTAALADAKKLLSVGAFCIGTEQVDLAACAERGIAAFNAPYSNTRSVVELAMGETILLLRRVVESSAALHAGRWRKTASGSFEVRGKRLGIVGYGNIGSQLSVLAESMGLEVMYFDVVEKLALGNAKKCRSLAELLAAADIVSLHVDGRASNRGLIGRRELALMRKGSVLLNLSRGGVIDVAALAESLRAGHLAGAAIDVYPVEPAGNSETFESELRGLPNVILTPHIGGSTLEAQRNIAEYVAARLIDYINSGGTYGAVNFPNIQLPTLQRAHRFLHVHRNVPGILAQVNGILAKRRINVLGQYLKTDERIGYVITDVNRRYGAAVLAELKAIPDTIRFRVLY